MLDGKYSNHIDVLSFDARIVFPNGVKFGSRVNVTENIKNISASLYSFNSLDPVSKKKCTFDMQYFKQSNVYKHFDLRYEDANYNLKIQGKCLNGGVIQTEMHSVTELHMDYYCNILKTFTIYATLLMLMLIYHYDSETNIYEILFRQRLNTPETHGHQALTYAHEFSLLANSQIFLCNFVLFMVYFQFCIMGLASLGISFQFPLFCQFLILFFYCNKH